MIGIVGYGFVGQAVSYGFSRCKQVIVDPKYSDTPIDDLRECEAVFICVPTPMGDDGSCDTSILSKVLAQVRNLRGNRLIVLKSTVPPRELVAHGFGRFDNEVYNPEFLTERGAKADFVTPKLHVFGGDIDAVDRLEQLYERHSLCDPAQYVFKGTVVEASLIKYMINTFLAMKVEFFNEWKDIADAYGAAFNRVANAVAADPRIGSSHTKVPGPDGKPGFGGSCFPKDLHAIVADEWVPLLSTTLIENNRRRRGLTPDAREIEQNVKWESK